MKVSNIPTLTKKAFKSLHKNNLIELLITSRKDCGCIVPLLDNNFNLYRDDVSCIKLSRIDLEDQGEHVKVKIYVYKKTFIIVEKTIDNSKSKNCSWDTLETQSIIYRYKQ